MLVALDLKAAFQNVSRRSMLHSLGQHDPDLATVFSRWFSGSTTHRMHYEGSYAHPGQQWNRPRMPALTMRLCSGDRAYITRHPR